MSTTQLLGGGYPSRRTRMMTCIPYIKASDLVRMSNEVMPSGSKVRPITVTSDNVTMQVVESATFYPHEAVSKVGTDTTRYLQLQPNHKYTLIVKSSVPMVRFNYIITYEAMAAAVPGGGTPTNIRFASGDPSEYTTTFTTGASGLVWIYLASTNGYVTAQIK